MIHTAGTTTLANREADEILNPPTTQPHELHIVVQVPSTDDAWRFASRAADSIRETLGPVELAYHLHDHRTTGGRIIGWNVITTESFEKHSQAQQRAELNRIALPAADVELEPVFEEAE